MRTQPRPINFSPLPWEVEHRHLIVTRRASAVLDRALALVVLALVGDDATELREHSTARPDRIPEHGFAGAGPSSHC